mmetsp:Transcript_18201/g.37432  ORF Transcript_18201/g.37432 Transcript_18201/m.37432 type:complete len:644 (+) Transcript_18201:117-2048(+)
MTATRRLIGQNNSASPDTAISAPEMVSKRSTRRSTRRIKVSVAEEDDVAAVKKEHKANDNDGYVDTNGNYEQDTQSNTYFLDGEKFTSYQDFVTAKRKRNQNVLMKLGFGSSGDSVNKRLKIGSTNGTANPGMQRGLKSNKKKSVATAPPVRSRRSSRISGDQAKLVALDMYANDWQCRENNTTVTKDGDGGDNDESDEDPQQTFFKGRVNDGSSLSLKDAIELSEPKWIHDDSQEKAKRLVQELTVADKSTQKKGNAFHSPISVVSASWENEIAGKVEALSIDKEEWVCKVTPDRIYSVATHPSHSKLICCAGDKQGYIGLWDVDGISNESEGPGSNDKGNNGVVSLFRVHSRPICCLEWCNNENMVTASYDGSVRRLNAETETFEEIFATFDDSDSTYLEDLGYGLDQGYRYWTQNVTTDHRYRGSSNPCLFVSTSMGDVFHVDLRVSNKQKITFHEKLSSKKINTVSLHPNGTTLAASGNEGIVRLFDIRKFGDSRNSTKSPKPICTQVAGLSVSSSFFSPSGKSLLATSFANRLDLTEDAHLSTGGKKIKPTHSVRHNNQTGRWLTTFQATWHPEIDIFCCGSLKKPRRVEIYNAKGQLLREVMGEALGSVMSRTCFHPSTNDLIMVGGNSSGRMVAIR